MAWFGFNYKVFRLTKDTRNSFAKIALGEQYLAIFFKMLNLAERQGRSPSIPVLFAAKERERSAQAGEFFDFGIKVAYPHMAAKYSFDIYGQRVSPSQERKFGERRTNAFSPQGGTTTQHLDRSSGLRRQSSTKKN